MSAPARYAAAATSAAAARATPRRRRSRPWPAASGRSSSGPIARPHAPASPNQPINRASSRGPPPEPPARIPHLEPPEDLERLSPGDPRAARSSGDDLLDGSGEWDEQKGNEEKSSTLRAPGLFIASPDGLETIRAGLSCFALSVPCVMTGGVCWKMSAPWWSGMECPAGAYPPGEAEEASSPTDLWGGLRGAPVGA
jgi:hypothetical protein